MKVAVTGHTSGIGQGLFNYFESQGHVVQGYSRSNGFALPDAEDRVLAQIIDCDIFVNNALPVSSQTFFVQQLWSAWKDTDRTILVIGSVAASLPQHRVSFEEYTRQKSQLDVLCKNLRYQDFPIRNRCRLITVNPGYTSTNIFSPNDPVPADQYMLSVADVVQTVNWVLNSTVAIDDITFRK
jgi:NADP-dependent 3-hydroxy acid dehydrogenase YdfG